MAQTNYIPLSNKKKKKTKCYDSNGMEVLLILNKNESYIYLLLQLKFDIENYVKCNSQRLFSPYTHPSFGHCHCPTHCLQSETELQPFKLHIAISEKKYWRHEGIWHSSFVQMASASVDERENIPRRLNVFLTWIKTQITTTVFPTSICSEFLYSKCDNISLLSVLLAVSMLIFNDLFGFVLLCHL